jgi:hypothetical protein
MESQFARANKRNAATHSESQHFIYAGCHVARRLLRSAKDAAQNASGITARVASSVTTVVTYAVGSCF